MSSPKISRRAMREAALQVLYCQAFMDPDLGRATAAVEATRTVDAFKEALSELRQAQEALRSVESSLHSSIAFFAERIKPESERKQIKHTDPALTSRLEYTDKRKDVSKALKQAQRTLDENEQLFGEKSFTIQLLRTYRKHEVRVNAVLDKCLEGWTLRRLTAEDGAGLRLGITELLYFPNVPPAVIVNEYVEIAKDYGDNESPKLINAVLDRVVKEYPRENSPAGDDA